LEQSEPLDIDVLSITSEELDSVFKMSSHDWERSLVWRRHGRRELVRFSELRQMLLLDFDLHRLTDCWTLLQYNWHSDSTGFGGTASTCCCSTLISDRLCCGGEEGITVFLDGEHFTVVFDGEHLIEVLEGEHLTVVLEGEHLTVVLEGDDDIAVGTCIVVPAIASEPLPWTIVKQGMHQVRPVGQVPS